MNVYLKNDSLEMEPLTDEERIEAARDPLTTPEQLNKLSMDVDSCVRYYVAGNPATPIEAITRLGKVRTSIPRTKNENFSHLISMGYQ
ncbi:hypothetical protein [Aeromonas caviae]|uniref:Uncharacterized protein n=1 Tax=Aeromonas caviae TaxID=648 RepID=A0AA37D5D0_AERCA|nr:hypothetical protein [Aeromonas caviae]GJA21206.1 hypothetical protein KAM336_42270 [Aeromonas caviae]GJA30079.1 hypothetical protein KAM340_42460 [Aeromonas caviae]GJA65762.1 hypothetical protein KAM351_43730 [Aeromonas caviae]GJA74724.1 hypothetical protein KAM353_43710 [Aeromonas caviae]